mmetsp:Transcript_65615/g.136668  ORF Transcript_65615/g.136668 Transcript_65615/m.136668 type:complete len:438 (+) Transcript_65615:2-1315(+)
MRPLPPPPHHVVEPLVAVGVHEAVPHPPPRRHPLPHLVQRLERRLAAVVLVAGLLEVERHRLLVVLQHEQRRVRRDAAQEGGVVPEDVLDGGVDAAHGRTRLPVVEEHKLLPAPAGEHGAAEDGVDVEVERQRVPLLEVPEQLHLGGALAGGVVALGGPDDLEGVAVALRAPRQRRVHDVAPVPAHHGDAALGVVAEALRVDLAVPQLLHLEGDALAVDEAVGARALHVHHLHLVVLRPDDLAAALVHGGDGLLLAHLDDGAALVVAQAHAVRALAARDAPHALHAVVERVLQRERARVEDAHRPVLAAGDDHGEVRVEGDTADILRVVGERLHAVAALVVPDLDSRVVCAADEEGLIAACEVVDAVDALFVPLQREVRLRGVQPPHLDRAVKRGGGERVRVLGVEHHLHDIVRMPLVHLFAIPVLLPIPDLDRHVV